MPAEVAARLSVCRAVVYKLIASGQLPHFRVAAQIRVSAAALAHYLGEQAR